MRCLACGQQMREQWSFAHIRSSLFECPSCGCMARVGPDPRCFHDHRIQRVVHILVFEHESNTVEEW